MSSIASQPLSTPLQMEPVSNQDSSLNVGPQKPLLPSKRKAAAESFSNNPLPLHSSIPNKRVESNSPRVGVSPLSVNKKQMQVQSMSNNGQPNKRMMRNESMSSKTVSPRVQMSKSKTTQSEVSPKVQSESFVRAKMRETLAAALSVGIQNKEEQQQQLSNEDKNVNSEAGPTADVDIKETSEGQKPQYNYVMPDTDGSFGDTFFVKDELLQGNGLSWAWDMEVDEKSNSGQQSQPVVESVNSNGNEEVIIDSPQELAIKIEAELFKLFGGVNKKYKEKGRSLMFNLKDRNNPELREKVLSGKISPERLCSMTPEELASKELSEWRMAKAEELDKMIVLPDSDVDMRRLVKKTHKGEYQVVDFEQDDGISVEVAVGSTSLTTQFRPKKKKTTENLSSDDGQEVKGQEVNGQEVDTDYMQELIVEEFKDEGFLPPIVSLDEFMESLDTEPPFENLTADGNKDLKAESDKDKKESGGPTSAEVEARVELPSVKSGERKVLAPSECLWEGDLQLTISSTVSVIGLFRSGEKTSTKEWPGSIEIKGRVRLEAFEKFLQELPMSRSRAVMVVHFVLKDKSPEFHRASLSESVDSYVAEERVGFGEPISGTEVYFCPPNKRITEMLTRLLSKGLTDIQKSTDDGLIGVVVWRRPQPPAATLPPHHKHHRKNIASRKQETLNTNTNLKPPPPPPDNGGGGGDDDDDDIPPGFGPGVVARDEDDLPEFSFSGRPAQVGQLSRMTNNTTSTPRPPVTHMRQLVHEYGQTANNNNHHNHSNNNNNNHNQNNKNNVHWNGNRHWNRDEDDDIPEWQPQPQLQIHHQAELGNHMVNQVRPVMGVGPNVMNVNVRAPPNLMQNVWGQAPNAAMPGWPYGGQWRPEEPRGRGF